MAEEKKKVVYCQKCVDGKWVECEAEEAEMVVIYLPGVEEIAQMPVIMSGSRRDSNCWSWNGDVYEPTFKPSLKLSRDGYVNHSWVGGGKVQYLNDCTHEFKGQTLPLIPIEECPYV